MRIVRQLFVLAVVACLVAPSLADDAAKKGKGKKGNKGAERGIAQAFNLPKGVELNDEQQAKVAELKKEYGGKLQAAMKKVSLSPDQRKAMAEARKAAAADGKKGREAMEAALAAANLTDDQKAAMQEANELRGEIRKQLMGLLTKDQRAKLRPDRKPGERKPKDRKPKQDA